jgi:hypothetical protein
MNYTVYNPDTGEILYATTDVPEGASYVVGNWSSLQYYIANGQAVNKPKDPSTAWSKYHFDYATRTWQLDSLISEFYARQVRDQLLSKVDRVNPIWYASLTVEQQTQLQQYRQALLSVPQQTGFPAEIAWPTQPAWL